MNSKLWFVTNGVQLLAVFDHQEKAEQEMRKYQDDPDYGYYEYYGLYLADLDNYPDEYDIAYEEGFIS